MLNGAAAFVARKAPRNAPARSTSTVDRRLANVTVKKYVPPGTWFRRYRNMGNVRCEGLSCFNPESLARRAGGQATTVDRVKTG